SPSSISSAVVAPVKNATSSLAARQFALQQHIAKHAYETVRKLLSSHSVEAARHRNAAHKVSEHSVPVAENHLEAALTKLQREVSEDQGIPLPQRVQQALQEDEQGNVHLDQDAQAAVDVIHNLFAGILSNPALSERVR